MSNKIDFTLKLSIETAQRFDNIADSLRFTREQTLTYLLDLYDKVKPEKAGFPRKHPVETNIHTLVQPEVRTKFRQLSQEYGLNRDQMLTVLLDIYNQCPERKASQLTWSSGMGTTRTRKFNSTTDTETGSAAAAGKASDAMAEVDAALDTIRRAFRDMAHNDPEIVSLREQLAQSQAETRKAKEAYRQLFQTVTAQLRDLA